MTSKEVKNRIVEILSEEMTELEYLEVYNTYYQRIGLKRHEWIPIDKFNEKMACYDALEIACMAARGWFSSFDHFFWFDANGNLISGNLYYDETEEIAEYAIENNWDLFDEEIRMMLDELRHKEGA